MGPTDIILSGVVRPAGGWHGAQGRSGLGGRERERMQGEAQPSASGAGRGVLDRCGPGKRELTVFVSVVFGLDLPCWAQYDPPLSLFFVPVVCGALALVAGIMFDRGFYL